MRCLAMLALLFAACAARQVPDGGAEKDAMAPGPPFYEACTSPCVRLSDCVIAYPNDELCPPGFSCAIKHPACTLDGAARD